MSRPAKHDCPCCECGMVELNWSDRIAVLFPDDIEEVVNVLMELMEIVERHMSAVAPDWKENTANVSPAAKKALREELTAAVTRTGGIQ